MKTVDALTEDDLRQHPVWEFVDDPAGDETSVRPVEALPVSSLAGKVVGTQVLLANGEKIWALVGNVDASNPERTEHFLMLSIRRDSEWFHVARYHDFDAAQRGPDMLASFLGLAIDDVYPISYDIRAYAKGDPSSLCRSVPKEPPQQLTRAEIIALAVP
jgi:hypothetical protein